MAAEFSADADTPTGRAVDRCPYSRSFTPAFVDDPSCPAYQGTTFTVLDTADRPLRAALTCRHLTVGGDQLRAGRFYPRCGLGGPDERLRWVASITPARVAVMRSLEEELTATTLAERAELLSAKVRLLRGNPDPAAVEDLEVRLSMFLDRVDVFIDERADRLADVGLSAGQVQELLADWSMAWLRSQDVFGPPVDRAAQHTEISPVVAALLGAELGAQQAMVPAAGAVTTQARAVSITRTEDPPALRVSGEIDVLNSDSLATAVDAALADGAGVTIDFSEVLFCDLGGLRALARAAETMTPGQVIRVVGLPTHLLRAARLVGWHDKPGLVMDGLRDAGDGGRDR